MVEATEIRLQERNKANSGKHVRQAIDQTFGNTTDPLWFPKGVIYWLPYPFRSFLERQQSHVSHNVGRMEIAYHRYRLWVGSMDVPVHHVISPLSCSPHYCG